MSAFTEKLKDRWDGFNPRERRLVVLFAIALPTVLILFIGLKISDGLGALEARNARTRNALSVLTDLRARGPLKPADDAVAAITETPLGLESYLATAATKVGITLPSLGPRKPPSKDGFLAHGIQMNLTALTLPQLKDFLEAIENSSKVVVVTTLNLTRNDRQSTPTETKLDARLEVVTYSREPETTEEGGE